MARKFKLGPKADVFYDPLSQLLISGKEVKEYPEGYAFSDRCIEALKHSHIVEVFGEEAKSVPEVKAKPLSKMSDEELAYYYTDNFEVSTKDLETFKAMSKKEKVTFLRDVEVEE